MAILKGMWRRSVPVGGTLIILAITGISFTVRASADHEYLRASNLSAAEVSSAAVKSAVAEALIIHQLAYTSSLRVLSSPPMLRKKSTAIRLPTRSEARAPVALSAVNQQKLRAIKIAQVRLRFEGAAAARENDAIDAVEEANKNPNFRSLDGGVSKIVINSLSIASRRATVHAQATMWASMAQRNRNSGDWVTATPKNTLEITMRLNLDPSGKWVVSRLTWRFTPRSEP